MRVEPDRSRIELWTYKEGLLSGVAHDLCFRAERYQLQVERLDERLRVTLELQVEGLELRGQVKHGHVTPMRPKDAADIRKNLLSERVLDAARHPTLRYEGEGARPQGGQLQLDGQLTLRGQTLALPLSAQWSEADEGRVLVEGEVRFTQSRWGIKPFTALLGSLRVRDELRVSWTLQLAG